MSSPAIYSFPSNAVITEIERERTTQIDQSSMQGSIYMPIDVENAETVLWEIRDNVNGLLTYRGSDTPFPVVKDTGSKRYFVTPGRFGEQRNLDEARIERMRRPGDFGAPLDVTFEIGRIMNDIAYKELMTIEYIRWTLLATGKVTLPDAQGNIVKVASYTPNTYFPLTPWTNQAASTPLNDLRTVRDTFIGLGHNFGYLANAVATTQTWNKLLANTNAADIYGKRGTGVSNILGLNMFNASVAQDEDVPQLIAYNGTYLDATNTVQRFIPDGYVVVIGYNMSFGLVCGQYVMTRNAANPSGEPGIYASAGVQPLPPQTPWAARGHNGAPRINYTKQVVVMKVY